MRPNLPTRYRLLGILPLGFFFGQLLRYLKVGGVENLLWMCNVSNLTLSVGILLDVPFVIAVSVLWIALGFPLWIFDLWVYSDMPASTVFAHIGGLSVALFVLSKVGVKKNAWIYSFLWFLFIQQLCRSFTEPQLNINVAHSARDVSFFSSYFQYWLATSALCALSLLAFELTFSKIFKVRA